MLVNTDLAGHSFLFVRRPRAELFKMTAVKLFVNGLGNKPPVAVSVQALVQELNSHPHIFGRL
jgi:hypothetical protein